MSMMRQLQNYVMFKFLDVSHPKETCAPFYYVFEAFMWLTVHNFQKKRIIIDACVIVVFGSNSVQSVYQMRICGEKSFYMCFASMVVNYSVFCLNYNTTLYMIHCRMKQSSGVVSCAHVDITVITLMVLQSSMIRYNVHPDHTVLMVRLLLESFT